MGREGRGRPSSPLHMLCRHNAADSTIKLFTVCSKVKRCKETLNTDLKPSQGGVFLERITKNSATIILQVLSLICLENHLIETSVDALFCDNEMCRNTENTP